MAKPRIRLIAVGALILVVALVVFINPVGIIRAGQPEIVRGEPDDAARGQQLCGSQATVEAIKQVMFEAAIEDSEEFADALSRLEADSVARIEEPVLIRYDQELRRATCEGRIVIELPRGVESAFDDQRRLRATLEYVAQPAADGSGMVFRLDGADDAIAMLGEAELRPVRFRREERMARFDKPTFEEAWYEPERIHDPYDKPGGDWGYQPPVDYIPYPGDGPDYGPPFHKDNGFTY
ncbi:MAG: hypothetical protein H7X93_09340 [Sphingomonadaceae bacterium]|nr:hypothetical protein [Sphingomonadaceae bacterium]